MPRPSIKTLTIPLVNLELDELNPRLDPQASQRDAIRAMIKQQGEKIINLAADIAEHGLSAAERFMAMAHEKRRFRYVSLDGNRRLVALKLLHKPTMADGVLSPRLQTRLNQLAEVFLNDPIDDVDIALFESREHGALWVARRHSINMNGVGQDSWESLDKQRFDAWRGYESREWQVLETVRHHGTLAQQDIDNLPKIPITTLKRLIADRYIKTQLGLDYHEGRVHSTIPDADIILPLQRMVLDLLHKRVDVTHLALMEDRKIYFDSLEETISFREAPQPTTEASPKRASSVSAILDQPAEKRPPRAVRVKERKTVILPSGKLGSAPEHVQAIYRELQHVDADTCSVAGSMLLSSLVTISLDNYLGRYPEALPPTRRRAVAPTLPDKLLATIQHLAASNQLSDEQAAMLRQNIENGNLLAVNPALLYNTAQAWPVSLTGANLRSIWTNIQPLIDLIWP